MGRAHAGEKYTLLLESMTVTWAGCMSESGVHAVILDGVCAVLAGSDDSRLSTVDSLTTSSGVTLCDFFDISTFLSLSLFSSLSLEVSAAEISRSMLPRDADLPGPGPRSLSFLPVFFPSGRAGR